MSVKDVSRETREKLKAYTDLLLKWNKRINLIARSTEKDVWSRHILDCVAAVRQVPDVSGSWVDIGSGGGLPGLVAAIIHADTLPSCVLIESDQRKSAFLRTVARELDLNITVHAERIENIEYAEPQVLSARALASLDKLLDLTAAHHESNCTFLFMKGRTWKQEVEEAGDRFRFVLDVRRSVTDTESATLLISNVERRSDARDEPS